MSLLIGLSERGVRMSGTGLQAGRLPDRPGGLSHFEPTRSRFGAATVRERVIGSQFAATASRPAPSSFGAVRVSKRAARPRTGAANRRRTRSLTVAPRIVAGPRNLSAPRNGELSAEKEGALS